MAPLFFFSYARNDQDPHLEQFYNELIREVRQQAGINSDEQAGFRDTRDVEIGELWPTELTSALGAARAMVCLYSPTYFKRENCGREWSLFSERLQTWKSDYKTDTLPPLIIPVLWRPVKVPRQISHVQWQIPGLRPAYEKDGLLGLMRLKEVNPEYKEEYVKVLVTLAKAITERTREYPLFITSVDIDYSKAANAFEAVSPTWTYPGGVAKAREQVSSGSSRNDTRSPGEPAAATNPEGPSFALVKEVEQPGRSSRQDLGVRIVSLCLVCVVVAVFVVFYFTKERSTQEPVVSSTPKKKPRGPEEDAGVLLPPSILPAGGGSIRGTVRLLPSGRPLVLRPAIISPSPDPACKDMPLEDQSLIVNNNMVENVFVRVRGSVSGSFSSKIAVIDQQRCTFLPRVQGVTSKQPILIKNSDDTLHNSRGLVENKSIFNVAQPPDARPVLRLLPDYAEIVQLRCDIHSWMKAWIVVNPNPFFATTDENGAFLIEHIPPGTYVLEAWHEVLGIQTMDVTVTEGETASVSLALPKG